MNRYLIRHNVEQVNQYIRTGPFGPVYGCCFMGKLDGASVFDKRQADRYFNHEVARNNYRPIAVPAGE